MRRVSLSSLEGVLRGSSRVREVVEGAGSEVAMDDRWIILSVCDGPDPCCLPKLKY